MTFRTSRADDRVMDRLRDADPAAEAGVDERGEADLQLILAGEVAIPLTSSADGRGSRGHRRSFAVAAAVVLVVAGLGAGVRSIATQDPGSGRAPSAAAPSPVESPATGAADAPAAAGPSSATLTGPAPAPDAQALLDATSTGVAVDYDVAATPSELAETADLVTVGSVVGVTIEGPAVNCDDPAGPSSGTEGVLLRLGDLQVVQGRPGGDTVEVVVPLGGEDALQSALPLGTRVLVYASSGTAADCAPVFRATGPQSLAVRAAGGQVVWPMLDAVRTGELAEALPDGSLIAP